MVWLGVIYIKVVVRQLKKQINAASDVEYIGKSRCESAAKNSNVMAKFYKIVVAVMLILIVVFVGDELARIFAFFRNSAAIDETSISKLSRLINVSWLLGLLAYSGFWYMVGIVRDYSVDLVKKCKELQQR